MSEGWLSFGERTLHPGALRVDIRPVADVVGDIRCLDFPDNRFDGVECWAVIEHVTRDEAPVAMGEVFRVLKPGGVLEIATQDMEACARTLLAGDLAVLLNIYSPDPEQPQNHRWGYTLATFTELIREAGFVQLEQIDALDPNGMAIRARKPVRAYEHGA